MRRAAVLLTAIAIAASVRVVAMQPVLDAPALQEAIAIGQSRLAAERARFHQPYRIPIGTAPVDYVDIVTPFRRVELAAEALAAAGEHGFGQRQALEILGAAPDQIDAYVELTFHPLNTYIGVPDYDVMLLTNGGNGRVLPLTIDRIPRYGARVDGLPLPLPTPGGSVRVPKGSQPMLGGTIIARFDARMIDPGGSYDVVVTEARAADGRGGHRDRSRAGQPRGDAVRAGPRPRPRAHPAGTERIRPTTREP
jgi:hypothetical protein